jgi:hypothetical protein
MAFFSGALLVVGTLPAWAAPAPSVSATLEGPRSMPCNGPDGTEPVGTATIQGAKAKGAIPAGHRLLRVSVTANQVRARTIYNVMLATTVTEPSVGGSYAVGCRFWSAGTVSVNGNGRLAFSGEVAVPSDLPSFEVYVAPAGPADVGYTTDPVGVAGL